MESGGHACGNCASFAGAIKRAGSGGSREAVVQGDGAAQRAHDIDEAVVGVGCGRAGRILVRVAAHVAADLRIKLAHAGVDDTTLRPQDGDLLVALADHLESAGRLDPSLLPFLFEFLID